MKMGYLLKVAVMLCSILLIACTGKKSSQTDDVQVEEETVQELESTTPAPASDGDKVVNYLGATKSISLDDVAYNLAWSHPPQMEGAYYIQEYMPDGQVIEKYEDIFILDLYREKKTTIKAEVKEKVDWLNKRKATDPTTNYKVSQNEKTGEYMIDLIVSDGNTIEWNVIRYAEYTENGKFAGVKSFTMGKRGYKGMDTFVKKMHPIKSKLTKQFLELSFPEIKPIQ